MNNASILVTGANGFIGSHLTQELVRRGHTVRALVQNDADHPFLKDVEIEIVKGDVLNKKDLHKAIEGISFVYHCAGCISYKRRDTAKLYAINVEGTRNVLEVCLDKGVQRIVHVSSVSAIAPLGPYGQSKRDSELVCNEYIKRGLDVVITQPATVYGAGDIHRNSVYPFKKVALSKNIFVPPGGKSYVHVSDLIVGLILAMRKGKKGEQYVFATENVLLKDVYTKIAQEMGKDVNVHVIPSCIKPLLLLLIPLSSYSSEALKIFGDNYFSAHKSIQELGWHPQHDIVDAVHQMFLFYNKLKMIETKPKH